MKIVPLPLRPALALGLLVLTAVPTAPLAAEEPYAPPIAEASNEGETAIRTFVVPASFT